MSSNNDQNSHLFENNIIVLNNNNNDSLNYCGFLGKRNLTNTKDSNFLFCDTFNNNGYNCLHFNNGSSEDNFYNDMIIRIEDGQGKSQTRIIEKYYGTDKKVLLNNDLHIPVSNGDKFTIYDNKYIAFLFDEEHNEFVCGSLNTDQTDNGVNTYKDIHCNSGRFNSNVTALSVSTLSDQTLKKNITPLNYDHAIYIVNNLQGVEFEWEENKISKQGKQIGLIAQEVEKVLPNIVNEDKNKIKSVEYDKLVPILLEVIKGLNKRVEELEKLVHKDI